MKNYPCTLCHYFYDPGAGDMGQNVDEKFPSEQLPADWVCPDCGAEKDMFDPLVRTSAYASGYSNHKA